jgi:hypothetical protein
MRSGGLVLMGRKEERPFARLSRPDEEGIGRTLSSITCEIPDATPQRKVQPGMNPFEDWLRATSEILRGTSTGEREGPRGVASGHL